MSKRSFALFTLMMLVFGAAFAGAAEVMPYQPNALFSKPAEQKKQ